MPSSKSISVLIPTYKRAHVIVNALRALRHQTHADFETIVILKPSEDGTEEIVEKFRKWLDITVVVQNKGYVTDALNLGFQQAKGDIIAFLDDDAIPYPDWLQRQREAYRCSCVGGVAGNVIPAKPESKDPRPMDDRASEIIPDKPAGLGLILDRIGIANWKKPLEGQEDFLVYISKAGLVEYNSFLYEKAHSKPTNSLLGMGANMSVLSETVRGFQFPRTWVLGLGLEQFLGWHIWKQGYRLLFDPRIKVLHLSHSDTLSRNISRPSRQMLNSTEHNLLFYRLKDIEPNLSTIHRIAWLVFSGAIDIKKLCIDHEMNRMQKLKAKLLSEILGLKWLISKKTGGGYTPLADLVRLRS